MGCYYLIVMEEFGKNILPALALILGILTSIYFLVLWWRHRHEQHDKSLLFWALALFLMYWFQIPAILFSATKLIIVSNFNLFFALTFPITLLALIFIYLGILQISKIQMHKNKKRLFFLWFSSAIIFFIYQFISNNGIIDTYTMPLVGNIVFYLPIRLLIIFVLVKNFFRMDSRNIYWILGVVGVVGESILGLSRNFFIIKNVLTYPPELWYAVIASSTFFFVTQIISILLLIFGFFFLHIFYHHNGYKRNAPKI